MVIKKIISNFKSVILITILTINYGCDYNERDIIKDEGIKQRIVSTENDKHSVAMEKTILYRDYFNDSGQLIKRENYTNPNIFSLYDYDTLGRISVVRGFNNKKAKKFRWEIGYLYDDFNNLIYRGYKKTLPKYRASYYPGNKLKTLVIFDYRGRYSEIFSYSYNWKGDLIEELEIIYRGSYIPKLNKIEFKYNFKGQLHVKNFFSRELAVKPYLENDKLIIADPIDKEYKLKYIYEYKYNNINLLKEELKCNPTGYCLEKTIYEYK